MNNHKIPFKLSIIINLSQHEALEDWLRGWDTVIFIDTTQCFYGTLGSPSSTTTSPRSWKDQSICETGRGMVKGFYFKNSLGNFSKT